MPSFRVEKRSPPILSKPSRAAANQKQKEENWQRHTQEPQQNPTDFSFSR
jgi:hypothetical protein